MLFSNTSGLKTEAAQILSQSGALMGVDAIGPTVGCAIIRIYDSADSSTSGKLVLSELHVDAGMMSLNHEYFRPVVVNNGMYVTVTYADGSEEDATYIVRYALG